MEGRVITAKMIAEFKEHLILEERSVATIQKYIRDVKAFTAYAQNSAISKEIVIAYKKYLQENYAVRSVNSMLASINSFFSLFGWNDLKVKSLKLQQQVFCPEEKELTKGEYTRLCRAAVRKRDQLPDAPAVAGARSGHRRVSVQLHACRSDAGREAAAEAQANKDIT